MKKFVSIAASIILIYSLFFNFVSSIKACGPFTVEPVFSLTRHADFPLVEYVGGKNGKIGVVPDSFGRMSLFVFYRQLNNLPFTSEEQKQIAAAIQNRIGNYHPDNGDSAAEQKAAPPDYFEKWKAARAKILVGDQKISTEKLVPDGYNYYSNCLADAFNNATKTLEDRIDKYGSGEAVKDWLNGQDAVFSNCGEARAKPESLGENFPDWLRRDREYQIAAALFYAGDNAAARQKFERIAADEKSVWNKTAKFVIARTYIRQASFIEDSNSDAEANADSNISAANANQAADAANSTVKQSKSSPAERKKERNELLRKAQAQLRNILLDAALADFHESARRLSGLVAFRLNPQNRQTELAGNLWQSSENKNIYNDLIDYIWLLDPIDNEARVTGEETERKQAEQNKKEYDYDYRLKLRDVPQSKRRTDLTDWLFTYQAADGFKHAFEKWKETGRLHWLVAATIKIENDDEKISDILGQIEKIPKNSPAFATVRFHQIRLLLGNGKRSEARKKLDEILSDGFKELPVSAQNEFLAERMATAENLDEFLKFAQRRAAAFVWSDDAGEAGDDLKSEKELSAWKNRQMFDEDAVAFFNEKMPLSTLREAALSGQLPEHLKKFLTVAVWTRAFTLGNQTIEREFAPLLARYAKEFSPELSKYQSASNADEREAAALLLILRNPVVQPFVPVGYGRENSPATSIDSIRGNWWCSEDESETDKSHYNRYPFIYPNFLTAAETATADREHRQIMASGNSATFLARRAVEFANRNPGNAQTPEILHLAVRATRYGCTDIETLKFSKQAFQILHKNYPNSDWAKKTPYWFGN